MDQKASWDEQYDWLVIFDHIPSFTAHTTWDLKRQFPPPPGHCFWGHMQIEYRSGTCGGEGKLETSPTLMTLELPTSYHHCIAQPRQNPLCPACSCQMCHLSGWAMGRKGPFIFWAGSRCAVRAQWHSWGPVGHRSIRVNKKPLHQDSSTHCCARYNRTIIWWLFQNKKIQEDSSERVREDRAAPAENTTEPEIRQIFIKNIFKVKLTLLFYQNAALPKNYQPRNCAGAKDK